MTDRQNNRTLHTLNASPQEYPALLARLLCCASDGDAVLLIENGVYAIIDRQALATLQTAALSLYALRADVTARGLMPVPAGITMVDDSGFVALCTDHRKVVSWFS